jgi:hypothetical protein
MTSDQIAQRLIDSKAFCKQMREICAIWTGRKVTDAQRVEAMAPLVTMIVAECEDAPAAGDTPERREVRHERALAPRQEAKPEGPIQIGQMGEDPGTDFDPFKHPEQQGAVLPPPLPPPRPSPEPNPVEKRKIGFEQLKTAIEAQGPWGYGQKKTFLMPMDWNANERDILFRALGTHELAGDEGCKLAPNRAGWLITCFKKG